MSNWIEAGVTISQMDESLVGRPNKVSDLLGLSCVERPVYQEICAPEQQLGVRNSLERLVSMTCERYYSEPAGLGGT